MQQSMLHHKPVKRSFMRRYAGKAYYRMRRYVRWYSMRRQFARQFHTGPLPHSIARHATPLYRELHSPLEVIERYRYKIEERNHSFTLEAWGGYMRHNELYRHVYTRDGNWLREESITENHVLMMYAPLLQEVDA